MAEVIVLGTRSKSQPPPPHVVLEALAAPDRVPQRHWLTLLYDEVEPTVLPIEGASLLWSSICTKRPDAQVHSHVQGSESGSDLRWTLLDVDDPGPALTGHMCKRLNELINRDLRCSFGS